MNRVLTVCLALCAGLILTVAAQVHAGELQRQLTGESAIEQIIKRGTIRVGLDVFVPWAMKDKKGELIGFEVDVARKLAEDAGLKLELVPTEWSGIIPALLAGKFDMIIGGMTVTAERNLKVNFSDAYYFTGQGLLANKKMTENMALSDFNDTKITLAARMGSTAALTAKKVFPNATLRLFDTEPAAVQEVRNGRVHAMVAGQPLPAQQALASPDVLVAYPDMLMQEPIAIALRKGDVDTLNFLNNWIVQAQASGWIKERFEYWFESTDWQSQIQ
ncbi:MAG: transporter substrate-binding domain-containing protein [Desulfobulbaceae bacterium]|nr:transporter substrate-binding domain-containing protein [Desulfobulbaceae bacterium]